MTTSMSVQSDAELIPGLLARDEAAVQELIDRYWVRAHRVAHQLTGDAAAAEDVAQETLVAVLRGVGDLEDGASFRAWFFRILKNTAAKHLRTQARRSAREERRRPREQPADPADVSARAEEGALVRTHLARLSPKLRDTLVLRYLEGLSLAEVAAALEIPRETVSTRVRRGLQALRDSLNPVFATSLAALPGALLLAGEAHAAPEAPTAVELSAAATPLPAELTTPTALPASELLALAQPSRVLPKLAALALLAVLASGVGLVLGDPLEDDGPTLADPTLSASGSADPTAAAGGDRVADAAATDSTRSKEDAATGGNVAATPTSDTKTPATPTPAEVRIVVVDPNGRPVAGAGVARLKDLSPVHAPPPFSGGFGPRDRFKWWEAKHRTDGAGAVILEGLRPGETLVARSALLLGESRLAAGARELRIECHTADEPRPDRAGILGSLSFKGAPLADQNFTLQYGMPYAVQFRTDALGRFALFSTSPLEEETRVVVADARFGGAKATLTLTKDRTERVDLAFPVGGAAIYGRITLAGAGPARDAEVWTYNNELSPWARKASPDDDGRYRFDDLPQGTYRLAVRLTGSPDLKVEDVALGDGEARQLDVTVGEGAQVRGRLLGDDGKNRQRRVAMLVRPSDGASPRRVAARADLDAQGQFNLVGLEPGTYELYVFRGYVPMDLPVGLSLRSLFAAQVTLHAGQVLELGDVKARPPARKVLPPPSSAPAGSVAVRVLRAETGPTHGRDEISLMALDAVRFRARKTTLDEDASCRFTGVPPGRYSVRFVGSWYRHEVVVRSKERTEALLDLRDATGQMTVHLPGFPTGRSSEWNARHRIICTWSRGSTQGATIGLLRRRGDGTQIALRGLQAGPATLRLEWTDRYFEQDVVVQPGDANTASFTWPAETGRIRGRLETGTGAPRRWIHALGERFGCTALVGHDGTFVFADLPPGTYSLVASTSRAFPEPDGQLVTVVAGGEHEVSVR